MLVRGAAAAVSDAAFQPFRSAEALKSTGLEKLVRRARPISGAIVVPVFLAMLLAATCNDLRGIRNIDPLRFNTSHYAYRLHLCA